MPWKWSKRLFITPTVVVYTTIWVSVSDIQPILNGLFHILKMLYDNALWVTALAGYFLQKRYTRDFCEVMEFLVRKCVPGRDILFCN